MSNPLREIYNLIYTTRVGCHPMTKEESAVWDAAQEVLGEDMMDQMASSQCRSLAETEFDSFREGFKLGVLMMLEVFGTQ